MSTETSENPPEEPGMGLLLAYAMGTLSLEKASEVEQLLMSSQEALSTYLSIKRSLLPPHPKKSPKPSAAAKARLRKAVTERYAPTRWQQCIRWFQQPIPLYQGLTAFGLAIVLALLLWSSQANVPIHPSHGPIIDTSSHGAEQLDWS